jgi:hypothetical protein
VRLKRACITDSRQPGPRQVCRIMISQGVGETKDRPGRRSRTERDANVKAPEGWRLEGGLVDAFPEEPYNSRRHVGEKGCDHEG